VIERTRTIRRGTLGDVLVEDAEVPNDYYIDESQIEASGGWRYLKGGKSVKRVKKTGAEYSYDEGPIAFPDPLDRPSRTIITSEGGRTPSRFKHVIQTEKGFRRLVPRELERLNGFPDDHTKLEGVTDTKRAFFMGNALVVDLVARIGRELAKRIDLSPGDR
jgi:DNA (cytosine-5)-methyltransferase 1